MWKFILLSLFQSILINPSFAGPDEILDKHRIRVSQRNIAGIDAREIDEFPEAEKNRNHYDDRGVDPIKFLVMHYTVCDFEGTITTFTTNADSGRASAHYVITEQEDAAGIKGGLLFRCVPEAKRAWHAGVSAWGEVKNLNATSIGIENVNKGFVDNALSRQWFPFDGDQIKTLGQLSRQIVENYKILPQNVVGHADIAPTRKQDPGILFPWGTLHSDYQVGAWLQGSEKDASKKSLPRGANTEFFFDQLERYGYSFDKDGGSITDKNKDAVLAFKSHFSCNQQPEAYTPTLDENDMVWAWGLAQKYPHQ